MLTLFMSRGEVARQARALQLLEVLREALTAGVVPPSVQTLQLDAPGSGGSTLVRQASLAGLPAYAVTVEAALPGRAGAGRLVLQLHDAATGALLAVMDGGFIRQLRAALTGALATDVLARSDARDVAVLGVGAAASSALKALRLVRSLRRVWLYGPDEADSFELALRLGTALSMNVRAAETAGAAVQDADVVVLTGQVALDVDAVRPGAHVTVLGAEVPQACPLPTALMERSRRVCDWPGADPGWGAPFHAGLGEVLSKQRDGRLGPDDVTLFVSVAPAYLDLLAAWHVYDGARHDETLTRIDLEA